MARNRFTDPVDGSFYEWTINHSEEQESGKTRNFTNSATTSNVGLVRQQGDDSPMTLRYSGTILDRAQLVAFWQWFVLSRDQTIYFTDFDDQEYEVQIASFSPKRERTLRNPRDDSAPLHYWTYTMEMTVYRFVSGDLADAGMVP